MKVGKRKRSKRTAVAAPGVVAAPQEPVEHGESDEGDDAEEPARSPVVDLSAFADDDDDEVTTTREPSAFMHELVEVSGATRARFDSKGWDSTPYHLRIWKWNSEGKQQMMSGSYPLHTMSKAEIGRRWGSGDYQVRCVNKAGMFLSAMRFNIPAEEVEAARAQPSAVPAGIPRYGAPQPYVPPPVDAGDRMFQLLLAQMTAPKEQDGMRDAVSSMAKLMALEMQHQQMLRMQQPKESGDPELKELLRALIAAQAPKPAPVVSKGPSFAEVLPILQLGMNLGRGAAGAPLALNPSDNVPGWMKMLPEMADTVGVPLIATIAQAVLPPDKAQAVLETMNSHMQARTAEAEAGDDEPEEPGT